MCAIMAGPALGAETLAPLKDGKAPRTLDELWRGYDPTAEPLEVKVVRQWQRGPATVQMLVYTIGTFKGVKSRMGAYYAFPTKRTGKVPGILQMHGGGQRALSELAEAAAANGYACISINWGAKPMADQTPGDPGTDWGAVDATQTTHVTHYASLAPDDKTLDAVVSPRNNNWFLIVLAARRALTFLAQRPEVDAGRLGVTGHSMGGKLTVMTAGIDPRVKVAVPSCGGTAAAPKKLRDRPGSSCRPVNREPLYHTTIDDVNSIRRITCPILYIGPHNDFAGNLDNLYANWRHMPAKTVRFSISPHLNHRHVDESYFAGKHFFNVVLKGEGTFPRTPEIQVTLKTNDGVPLATVRPADPDKVVTVEVYYSVDPHALTRFWRTAPSKRTGNAWSAKCPVISTDMPLFVMANVTYPLKQPIVGPRWNRTSPKTFLVSSRALDFDPPDLKAAGVKATDAPDRLIVATFDTWQDWYRLQVRNDHHRVCGTRKIKDPKWRGPDGAKLAVDVLDPKGGHLVLAFDVNAWNAYEGVKKGTYYAAKPLAKSDRWQTIAFGPADLVPIDARSPKAPPTWRYVTELRIEAMARTRKDGKNVVLAGSPWPATRKLRNLRWTGGSRLTQQQRASAWVPWRTLKGPKTMNRRQFLTSAAAAVAAGSLGRRAMGAAARATEAKPNIILFLVDDMGWQDTSEPFWTKRTGFNTRYRTPNMQRLAAGGMKFSQAYACAVCSPTRVSLMTGLNAARHRVTNWTLHKDGSNDRRLKEIRFPKWNVNGLSPVAGVPRAVHAKSLPAFLKEAGYRTIHAGKAHFGARGTPGADPRNIGFDVNIAGHAAGGPGSYLGTQNFSAAFRKGSRVWDVPGLEAYHGKDIFLTEALTIEANKAVDRAVADRKPFFLYMAHYAVHVPFAPDKRFIARYTKAGLHATEAMYAAMVEGMDKSLGDLLANVQKHGLSDNTVVLFMSDNGGLSAHGRGGPRHSHNKPLSSGKGSAHEGGIRVPMIARWPGVTRPGAVCNEYLIIEDFFPTILEIAGVAKPKQVGGVIDGVSFVPMLRGKTGGSRGRALVWHFPNNWGPSGPGIGTYSAIRRDDWKLIAYHNPTWKKRFELFNIAADIGETTNLLTRHPDKAKALCAELSAFLKSVNAQMPTDTATGKTIPYPELQDS